VGRLDGKITLITGGTEGMGFATAQEFVAEGAFVFVTGRRQAEVDKAVAKLGENAQGIAADAGKVPDIERTYAEIMAVKGRLDVVFANAGIYKVVPWNEMTEEEYDRIFAINARGVFFIVQKAIPLMTPSGSIILNGSFIGSSGTPGMAAYGATKAAVRSFARTFTAELAGKGPRINVLSPGPIDTEGYRRETNDDPRVREATIGMVPIGRMGDPREIGRAAVFLASDDSSFCAGAEFFIDGGTASV
jgi:NAD(P)-dependent dehydrogenase (short-subunit alcohol dehydrogenase family)